MAASDFTIGEIKEELRERIDDFDRYNLSLELFEGIITVKCKGTGVGGLYEEDVDTGGKTFERVIDELTPKVVRLIKSCREKSP